jgi:hypothetical protein
MGGEGKTIDFEQLESWINNFLVKWSNILIYIYIIEIISN